MHGTLAADPIPDNIRDAGMTGVRVVFDVWGSRVRLLHELGAELFEADMSVVGNRMTGQALRTDLPVRFDLTRRPPEATVVPVPAPVARAMSPPPPPPRAAAPVASAPSVAESARAEAPFPETSRRAAPPAEAFTATPGLSTIHFDFDRAEIRPDDAAILDANADWLRAHPEALVLIEGHCDERGTAEYNLALGEGRALATMTYLVGRGVADTRITITSYGFERPLCTERTDACWSRNWRASFLVTRRAPASHEPRSSIGALVTIAR